jgi:hypothetical protein
MAEDSKFGDGYEAIFGKQKPGARASKKPASKKASLKRMSSHKPQPKKK